MLNAITATALAGNFYYHHQEMIKVLLHLKEHEKRPVLTDKDDFDLSKEWELKIREYLNKVIVESEKKPEIKITDNKAYRGVYKTIKKEKIPHGKGVIEMKNDSRRFIGTFETGELNGEGGIVDPTGSKIIGTFKNGSLDGVGQMINFFGKTYKGCFKNGQPYGKGKWEFEDGSFCITDTKDPENITAKCYEKNKELFYEGDYKNYTYTGVGKFYFDNGETYEGDVNEGIVEGFGVRRDKYGDELYKGNFANNQYVGYFQNREVTGYIAIGVINILLSLVIRK